ncbi:S53 family peptidase [Lentilactobacillus hilgardii]|uniref:Peptidase S53 n=1 Tax=Lentilactobacillus hilgardii TaxID=1588 RepID=A0A6P1E3U3_LENHI|nr:S53 family peptidase [Lentilactobacillus hilgardii]MCT3392392.1 peptidase S53 [Lentilactobacillus hilgardii]QHB51308.1 peptidase S53 [Lentilactobacillus hilgardii]RRG12254.1 MAG: peptidase S53 [Lactobacillus sp.]
MIILRGKQLIIATLSGFLVLGTGFTANAKAKKADNRSTVVNVAFKASNENDLTNYVYDTVDPNSANYHKYLSPSEFAQKFGQSDSYLSSFRSYLNRYHLSTYAYPGNLSLKIRGTKANVNKAFKAKYVKEKGHESKTTYKLPGKLSKQVVAVIGVYAPKPKTKKAAKKTPAKKKSAKKAAYIPSILKSADVPVSDNKPNTNVTGNAFSKKYGALKFADRYQLNNLYDKGLQGQGQRIGIISHADFRIGDIKTYWEQTGVNTDTSRIHRIYTVGGEKAVQKISGRLMTPGQLEASLDVQSASSVAPKANIDVYIAEPSNDATTTPSAHYTAFMSAISDNDDKQISTSFGPSVETNSEWPDHSSTLKQYNHAYNLMLEQAAAQGISVFRASGDYGRSESPTGKENHVVSTSPYQVIVGGTTLPYTKILHNKLIKVAKERAWGDTYSVSPAEIKAGVFPGSGGGFSALNPTPRYQLGVPGVNTFRAIEALKYVGNGRYTINKNPKVITGTGHSRNLPDVAGNADTQTGYATYFSGNQASIKGKSLSIKPAKIWMVGGGTSYTSPQMAAANAVMNGDRSTPIGFWNPQIYKFAQQPDTPFNVLDDANNNNNLYYTGQPGTLYNQATGLGTINFEKLYQKFNNESPSN